MRRIVVFLAVDDRGNVVHYEVTETTQPPPLSARLVPRNINRTLAAIRSVLRTVREACRA